MELSEYLEMAQSVTRMAFRDAERGRMEAATAYAAIAQAAAQTAQAMILHDLTTSTVQGLPNSTLTITRFDP